MFRRRNSFSVVAFCLLFQSAGAISLGPASVSMDGIMINLGLRQTTPSQLVEMLNYVCRNHRVRGGSKQYIGDLVLQDIADVDTTVSSLVNPPDPRTNDSLIWSSIEVLLPYFPGGNGTCQFEHTYVGTFALDSSICTEGASCDVANPAFRENLRQRQKVVAQKFTQKARQTYPNLKWEWYATQELCLDYVMYDFWKAQNSTERITEGWADFLSKILIDFESVVPGRKFLWSPMFDYVPEYYLNATGSTTVYIQERLGWMLSTVYQNIKSAIPACASNSTCPFTLSFQDHVGLGSLSSSEAYTKERAATWWNWLRPVFPFKNLTMNVEQFIYNKWPSYVNAPNTYSDADCQEVKERELYYASVGITVGHSYELAMWYSCNNDGVVTCESGWTPFQTHCYKAYPWTKQWADARQDCVTSNADLVSIHSKPENDFVVALTKNVSSADSIWIGLANPFIYTYQGGPYNPYMGTKNGSIIFQWSDKKPYDYLNWTPGWPGQTDVTCNSSCGTNCVAIYPANGGGQWGNAGCSWYAGAFVCKKDPINKLGIH